MNSSRYGGYQEHGGISDKQNVGSVDGTLSMIGVTDPKTCI